MKLYKQRRNSETKVITQDLSDYSSGWNINPTTVTKYNLFAVTDHLQQKQLAIQMEMWVTIIYYLGHIKHSCILYLRTTLLLEKHRSH